jgi:hypothetical protein
MMRPLVSIVFVASLSGLAASSCANAGDSCVSGLQPGQKPGPYSFIVATGPQRGQQTCYVCDTAEKPAIVIFARKLSDPLGRLLVKSDEFMQSQPKASVRSWMTVLGEKTASLDDVAKWSKNAGIKSVPSGVFDDPIGPPSYKLNGEAEVTVLFWVNRKVVANFAFRAAEFNDDAVKRIGEAMPKLIERK